MERRRPRMCKRGRLPMVYPDEFHTPTRSPRRVSISSIALPARAGLRFPVEIRPNVRAAPAATLADEQGLQIGKPDVIGPSVRAQGCPAAATEVRAIDQQTANASGAHLSERDLLLTGGHAPLKRGR
jgi:hypothetical protein